MREASGGTGHGDLPTAGFLSATFIWPFFPLPGYVSWNRSAAYWQAVSGQGAS